MNPEELKARARVMKALASPVRLKIVDELSRGAPHPRTAAAVPDEQVHASRHVAELRNVGIVGNGGGCESYLLLTPCVLNMFDCAMGVIRAEAKRRRMWPAGKVLSHERRQPQGTEDTGGLVGLFLVLYLSVDTARFQGAIIEAFKLASGRRGSTYCRASSRPSSSPEPSALREPGGGDEALGRRRTRPRLRRRVGFRDYPGRLLLRSCPYSAASDARCCADPPSRFSTRDRRSMCWPSC